jgi:putative transport protein
VGVRAGGQLLGALAGPGLQLFILGAACTIATFSTLFVLLRKWARTGIAVSLGAASGMHTQPASLARARELIATDDVLVAYATTYPFAMIGKIIIAQVLVMIGGA